MALKRSFTAAAPIWVSGALSAAGTKLTGCFEPGQGLNGVRIAAQFPVRLPQQVQRFRVLGIKLDGALQPAQANVLLVEADQRLCREKTVARRTRVAARGLGGKLERLLVLVPAQEEVGQVGVSPVVLGIGRASCRERVLTDV